MCTSKHELRLEKVQTAFLKGSLYYNLYSTKTAIDFTFN